MTGFNNKNLTIFKEQLNTPKTETRIILNDWQPEVSEVKKSKLSPAARNKIVNRNGNYVSERTTDLVPSYGPCFAHFFNTDGCDCNFGITAILIGVNGVSRSETIIRPRSQNEFYN